MKKKSIWLRWALTLSLLVCIGVYQLVQLNQADADPQVSDAAAAYAAMDPGPLLDGIYTGSGEGYGGMIDVEVTVSNGYIVGITVTSAEGEDKPYLRDAKKIINKVIDVQHTDLDAISGSTSTTWGILDAVDDALKEASK